MNTAATKNAQVTLTVVGFRSLLTPDNLGYVEAATTLAPHADVTLVDRDGRPTLRCTRPVGLEIRIAAATGPETYRPLAVYFRQRGTRKPDPAGKTNFEKWPPVGDTVTIRNKWIEKGTDGRYEFFVLIERQSDGNIGLIDPDIENETTE